jgi:hypothetical protein
MHKKTEESVTRLTFEIPIYEKAMKRFIWEIINGFFTIHPLFGKMPRRISEHRGPVRNVRGSDPLDQTINTIEGESSLSIETIRDTDFEDYTSFLTGFADSMIEAFSKDFYRDLGQAIDANGMMFDAQGEPFSHDMLNDMLDRLDIEFDEQGKPRMPTIITGDPKMAEKIRGTEPTPEQTRRRAKIIREKKVEYNAKKRTRQLS